MALTDTTIESWTADYTGADENTPLAGQLIATQLDDEVRNIMSVVRAEAENKNWERHGQVPTFTSSFPSAGGFSLPGDQRDVAVPGRRVKMFLSGATRYGVIISATYAAPNTAVAVTVDPIQFSGVGTGGTDQVSFVGDGTGMDAFGHDGTGVFPYCVIWDDASQQRFARQVVSVDAFSAGATVVHFAVVSSTATWVQFRAAGTCYAQVHAAAALNNTLSRVDFGPFTPDLYQSGWPHSVFGGSFTITLDGTAGPFAVNFPLDDSSNPIRTHDTNYTLHVQPTGIVSGSPSGALWTVVEVTTQTNTGFQVTLGGGPTGPAVVQYDYVVMRGN